MKSHVIAPGNLPEAETDFKYAIIIYTGKYYLGIVALYPTGYILLPAQKAGVIYHSTNAAANTVLDYFFKIFPETITFNFACHDKK